MPCNDNTVSILESGKILPSNFRRHDGKLFAGGTKLFENSSLDISVDATDSRGSFLGSTTAVSSSRYNLRLGNVSACSRLLACARMNLWWLSPSWGSTISQVPTETQFLLLKLKKEPGSNWAPDDGSNQYAVVLPLVSGAFRASLHGDSDEYLQLAVETGDQNTSSQPSNICFIATGDNPFRLIAESFRAVADKLQTFKDMFGWCTWDAFYQDVGGPGIFRGIESLQECGAPPRYLIIDDGWQDVQHDKGGMLAVNSSGYFEMAKPNRAIHGSMVARAQSLITWASATCTRIMDWYYGRMVKNAPLSSLHLRLWRSVSWVVTHVPLLRSLLNSSGSDWTLRLNSAQAGSRFLSTLDGRDFKGFVSELKAKHGVQLVYCWHALLGYWSGFSKDMMSHSDKNGKGKAEEAASSGEVSQPKPSSTMLSVQPELAWGPLSMNGIGMPTDGEDRSLYQQMHSYLAGCGVDGVKVDGQAAATMMGQPSNEGSANATRRLVKAMEASVTRHFGSHCINCMCHPTECLYSYSETAVARASDDFWPRHTGSWTTHIANVAYNSLFLGEIVQPDWDMFWSKHSVAGLHAAARAVGGTAVYVSDRPWEHDPRVLKRLVLPDGSVLRCRQHARPTADCLFQDVCRDRDSACKIWNVNACSGVLAAFNIQGAGWDRARRMTVVHDASPQRVLVHLRPSDVDDLPADPSLTWAMRLCVWRPDGPLKEVKRCFVPRHDGIWVQLASRESVTATVARVHTAEATSGDDVQWAAFGLEELINSGGAVLAEQAVMAGGEGSGRAAGAQMRVRGQGTLLMFASTEPATVRVGDEMAEGWSYDAEDMYLRVPYKVPKGAEDVEVTITF